MAFAETPAEPSNVMHLQVISNIEHNSGLDTIHSLLQAQKIINQRS
jgi:hypothetical protein